jgi:hypothetical protein
MTEQRRMMGIDVDMKLSLGNIIVIGTLAVTLVGGWFTLKGQTETNTVEIAKHATRLERLETQNSDTKDRLTRMEVMLQNMSIQLDRALRALERSPGQVRE